MPWFAVILDRRKRAHDPGHLGNPKAAKHPQRHHLRLVGGQLGQQGQRRTGTTGPLGPRRPVVGRRLLGRQRKRKRLPRLAVACRCQSTTRCRAVVNTHAPTFGSSR
jgi:hypothetical protein